MSETETPICLSKEGVEGLHSSSLFLKDIYLAVPGLSWGFPCSSAGKESACSAGVPGSIPGSGRSTGEGIEYPLQRSSVSLGAQLVKNPPQCRSPRFDSWVRKICWRRERQPTPVFLGFPGGSDGKEFACNAGNLGSILGLGRSPGEWNSYPLQDSCLENPHGQRSLADYSPWGPKELDTTEQFSLLFFWWQS